MGIASLVIGIIAAIMGFIPCINWFALVPAIVGVILGACGIGSAKKNNKPKGVAVAGLILNIAAVVLITIWSLIFAFAPTIKNMAAQSVVENAGNSSTTNAIQDRELRFMYVQGKILGEAVKTAVPNAKKVAVLVDPMLVYEANGEKKATPTEDEVLKALRDALPGVEFIIVCKPMKKIEVQKQKMPDGTEVDMPFMPDTMLTGADFMQISKEIKKADVFIATSMLPMGVPLKQILGQIKGVKVALTNTGSLNELSEVFEGGDQLIAVVASKNSADYNQDPARDDKKAFDQRYVLITPSNYRQKIAEAEKLY